MKHSDDPREEGHTREWADRARVEMDPKEDVKKTASPRQSPVTEDEDVEEKSNHLHDNQNNEPVY